MSLITIQLRPKLCFRNFLVLIQKHNNAISSERIFIRNINVFTHYIVNWIYVWRSNYTWNSKYTAIDCYIRSRFFLTLSFNYSFDRFQALLKFLYQLQAHHFTFWIELRNIGRWFSVCNLIFIQRWNFLLFFWPSALFKFLADKVVPV